MRPGVTMFRRSTRSGYTGSDANWSGRAPRQSSLPLHTLNGRSRPPIGLFNAIVFYVLPVVGWVFVLFLAAKEWVQ
jgi:hypothetical protein